MTDSPPDSRRVEGCEARGEQGQVESVGARADRDHVRHPQVPGELGLEGRHLRSAHESAGGQHARNGRVNIGF